MSRWPRSVYDVGDEPDPRFTLANERTFLARVKQPDAPVDTGLQVERTHLAWSRTTLCLATTLFVQGSHSP